MVLYSFSFFLFFAIIFFIYWKAPRQLQWIILLLASYYFYASWKPAYLAVVISITLITYITGLGMEKYRKNKTSIFLLGIILDLAFLLYFKYFNFFSVTLDQLIHITLPQFKIMQPIGISFFTLQVIGYLIDVYKGIIKPERQLGYLALYTCFFPQITAGPIERGTTLLPQFRKKHQFNYIEISEGIKLFLLGLFKKMVIADNLGIIVDRGFSTLPEFKGLSLILIIFFYSWQIYMDFSGYTDMARGVGKMVGITLLENFHFPYLSTSIQDFWRRWHMSFSSWLRDYIYFPLGGNRKGLPRTVTNTLIVFTVSGLWHGAAWTFVLWGFLHGITISIERSVKSIPLKRITIPNVVKIFYTYMLLCIFWIFFRSPTVTDAFYILKNALVGLKSFASINYIQASLLHLFNFDVAEIIIIFFLLSFAIMLEVSQQKITILDRINKAPLLIRFAVYILVLLMILQLRNAEIKQFIYVQF